MAYQQEQTNDPKQKGKPENSEWPRKNKPDQGACDTGACPSGQSASESEDEDEDAVKRMESEGDVPKKADATKRQ